MQQHIHFVTGRLAEHSLREVLQELSAHQGFAYSVDVLPITVAALMTPEWISRRLQVPADATQVLLPGYCEGDLSPLQSGMDCEVVRGPRDLRQLPEWFGAKGQLHSGFGEFSIQIIAGNSFG